MLLIDHQCTPVGLLGVHEGASILADHAKFVEPDRELHGIAPPTAFDARDCRTGELFSMVILTGITGSAHVGLYQSGRRCEARLTRWRGSRRRDETAPASPGHPL